MKRRPRLTAALGCLVLALAAACSPAAAPVLGPSGTTQPAQPAAASPTAGCPSPTEVGICSPGLPATALSLPTPTSVLPPTAALLPPTLADTPAPAPTPTPAVAPIECTENVCVSARTLVFQRPIASPGRDIWDIAYRFGSTQSGQREPHHGMEFLNSYGTPVLAVADGKVVVAGDDRETFYGPYSYFYGNLVVLEHYVPGIEEPVYSLYGHLSKIETEVGATVKAGQEIGQVGMSGVATGNHLHFEVRLGENTYANSRNPEIWLAPKIGQDGRQKGALAGSIIDTLDDSYPSVQNIVVQHLPAPDQRFDYEIYLGTYEEKGLPGQSPWQESFAAGDLEPGWYRISFAQYGLQEQVVQVLPGQLTMVTFKVGW